MRLSTDQRSRPAFRLHAVTVAPITQKGDDMSLLPSMFNATPSEVAAFRAHMRDRYHVPPDTPPDKAETAAGRPDRQLLEFAGPKCARPSLSGRCLHNLWQGRLLRDRRTLGRKVDLP
jgi:hypothetical protein